MTQKDLDLAEKLFKELAEIVDQPLNKRVLRSRE